jgi:hypothetical protein
VATSPKREMRATGQRPQGRGCHLGTLWPVRENGRLRLTSSFACQCKQAPSRGDLGSCPRVPVHTGTRGGTTGDDGETLTVRPPERFPAHSTLRSATLQDGGRAHLCATEAVHIPGSARTRHRFGDEIGTAVTSSQHAETAASPRGGAQGGTAYLAPHPSARQGVPAPRGDHHQARTTQRNNEQNRHLGHHWAVERRAAVRSLEK